MSDKQKPVKVNKDIVDKINEEGYPSVNKYLVDRIGLPKVELPIIANDNYVSDGEGNLIKVHSNYSESMKVTQITELLEKYRLPLDELLEEMDNNGWKLIKE